MILFVLCLGCQHGGASFGKLEVAEIGGGGRIWRAGSCLCGFRRLAMCLSSPCVPSIFMVPYVLVPFFSLGPFGCCDLTPLFSFIQ